MTTRGGRRASASATASSESTCVSAGSRRESTVPRDLTGRRAIERRILPEDRPLELLKRRARLDPELVDEGTAGVLVSVQGLRLPVGPVQRRHQLAPEPLAEGVLGDVGLELRDEFVVAPECEVGVDAELDRTEPDLLEPRDRWPGELLVREVRERRAAPQRQRFAEPL